MAFLEFSFIYLRKFWGEFVSIWGNGALIIYI